MRILLTKNGKIALEEIEQDGLQSGNKTTRARSIPLKRILPDLVKARKRALEKIKSIKKKKETRNIITTSDEVENSKAIKVASKKVLMPKGFEGVYDPTNEEDGQLIGTAASTLPNLGKSAQKSGGIFGQMDPNLCSFEEIIPNKTLIKTKLQLKHILREKEKNFVCNSSNFRTGYSEVSPMYKFKTLTQYPAINIKRGSLIEYLNTKDKITPLTIQSISECDSEKMNRVNKMAQIVMHSNERQKIREDFIKEKIKAIKNEEVAETNFEMTSVKDDIQKLRTTLTNYSKPIKRVDRYKHLHYENVKYWRNKGYDRMVPSQLDYSFLEKFRKDDCDAKLNDK